MMLMSQGAIEALEDQAYGEGRKHAREELASDMASALAQQKRLREVLEVEGDQTLVEAADLLYEEVRSHREAMKIASRRIEEQRHTINELRQSLLQHVKETA